MSVPKDVKLILGSNERVLKVWKSGPLSPSVFFGGWGIYATNRRLILKRGTIIGRKIIEVSYEKIGSIEKVREPRTLAAYIFFGLAVLYNIIFILFLPTYELLLLGGTFVLIAVFFAIVKGSVFKLNIDGRRKPIFLPESLEAATEWLNNYYKIKKKRKERKRKGK